MEAEADFNQVISGTNRTRINEKESQPPHHIQKVTQKLHPKKKNHYFVRCIKEQKVVNNKRKKERQGKLRELWQKPHLRERRRREFSLCKALLERKREKRRKQTFKGRLIFGENLTKL
ncbi:Uncharacterized protein TCM_024419 [Theobroma cacao]|uniref:Uncharacterized protein n=1 Tax=Theobroma cacao TaxID=3641 RepID=A0A061EVE6_THECC|nr:Uncharacterized protein TCM_024419 [Theobroma cacao]